MEVYQPAEDSYLLMKTLNKLDISGEIFEVGVGSGFQLENLSKNKNITNLTGCDINKKSVNLCKKKGLNCFYSDLFSDVKGKFDFIIFNPPYLPLDEREPIDSRVATTGGKKGGELINKFLSRAKFHLKDGGTIIILTSNLTKGINWEGYKKTLLEKMKIDFEELYVWKVKLS